MAEITVPHDGISRSSETVAFVEALKRENTELRAYLKAFCAATIMPDELGKDVQAHQANPFIEYEFMLCDEDTPSPDRSITGGRVRRAMELVGFDKLKIQPADRTIADELTEARDLRREVKGLRAAISGLLDLATWMSGSADFGPEGQAHEGWLKMKPAIDAGFAALGREPSALTASEA